MKNRILTVTLNPCLDKTITLDGFCEGGLNRAVSVRTDAGGKGINVAKVLGYFGASVTALGIMGDQGGERLVSELERRGIGHDFYRLAGEIRTNYKLFDRAAQQVTEVNEPGFSVSAADLEKAVAKIEQQLPDAGVMVLAGSTAPGIPADIYKRLTEAAKHHGVKVILDADGERLRAGLAAAPYAIKPNQFELEQLHGGTFKDRQELYAYCRSLLEQGPELIALSMGAEGAIYMTKEQAYRVEPVPIVCQSTVGAGDSMVAAIAHSLVQGLSLEALAATASAAGTVTASKPGTEVCRPEEVRACCEKLQLARIW